MILSARQICSILVREGYGKWVTASDKKKQFVGDTCTVVAWNDGEYFLYLHSGSINTLKKHFHFVDNVTIRRVRKIQAQ